MTAKEMFEEYYYMAKMTADNIFKELGYDKVICEDYIRYTKDIFPCSYEIRFYEKSMYVYINATNAYGRILNFKPNEEEKYAIQKKMEELGWFE